MSEINIQIAELRTLVENQASRSQELEKELKRANERIGIIEKELVEEKQKTRQIKNWIRDNIGPNLEMVKKLITNEEKETKQKPKKSLNSSQPEETKASKTKKEEKVNLSRSNPKSNNKDENIFEFFGYNTPIKESTKEEKPPIDGNFFPTTKRLKASNPQLLRIESSVFGPEITVNPIQEHDASNKANKPRRLNYFLNTLNHATLKYSCPKLLDKVSMFAELGGRFVVVPCDHADIERDRFVFGITESDEVYPICTDGLNRSQIMYLVILAIKHVLGTTKGVNLPHGAMSGFDPFILEDRSSDLFQHYKFLSEADVRKLDDGLLDKVFEVLFGQKRSSRFGQDKCGPNPDLTLFGVNFASTLARTNAIKIRESMRQYFDLYYYRQKSNPKGRIIYIVFGSALPIVLDRLMEVNSSPNSLSSVFVIAMPFGLKPFTTDVTAKQLNNTYKSYASLFSPCSDNSNNK